MGSVKAFLDRAFLVFPPFAFAHGHLNMVTMTVKARLFAPYGLEDDVYQTPLVTWDVMGANVTAMAVEAVILLSAKLAVEYNLHSTLKRYLP